MAQRKRGTMRKSLVPTAAKRSKRAGRTSTRRKDAAQGAIPVLRQFRELFRVSQQHFQRIESRCGLSGAQLWALSEIDKCEGLRVSELARAMSVHLSTASNLLDKLEARNLIRRERSDSDQRVVQVSLTAEGRKTFVRAPRPAEGVIPDALSRMPREALRRLEKDLALLLDLASVRNPRAALRPLAEP